MSEILETFREATRITCMVHQQLDGLVTERLNALGARTVLVEKGRCVRQRVHSRMLGLPGLKVDINDEPIEIFRATVSRDAAPRVLRELIEAVDLRSPGRGSVYAQDILEISRRPPPEIEPDSETPGGIPRELTLFTAILSKPGSGEGLARIALRLGAGVPMVSLGIGTGLRDRLGLLRITIPPEKELMQLIVPTHDADGLQRLLVEEGRMDRPGGGFLYQTHIRAGVVDPLVRIGRQEHAASMEQIIAAMDDLQRGTSWRKRFDGVEIAAHAPRRRKPNHRELVFVCPEGLARTYARAAIRAGAAGVTLSRVRCLSFSDQEEGVAARERGILCIPAEIQENVLDSIRSEANACGDSLCRLQIQDIPSVFSYQSRS